MKPQLYKKRVELLLTPSQHKIFSSFALAHNKTLSQFLRDSAELAISKTLEGRNVNNQTRVTRKQSSV